MKLHVFPASPRARKVLSVAHHVGLPFEQVMVNLVAGDQKKSEFLKLNPNGRMPVLEDGDFVLWEAHAIMQYLAGKASSDLYPATLRERADINRWMFWDAFDWDPACAILLFENFVKGFVGAGAPDTARVKEGEDRMTKAAKVLDAHLGKTGWLVGEKLSLADFALAGPMAYREICKFPLNPYKNIAAWFARIEMLDGWRKSAPAG